jgi:hypothetical protein
LSEAQRIDGFNLPIIGIARDTHKERRNEAWSSVLGQVDPSPHALIEEIAAIMVRGLDAEDEQRI